MLAAIPPVRPVGTQLRPRSIAGVLRTSRWTTDPRSSTLGLSSAVHSAASQRKALPPALVPPVSKSPSFQCPSLYFQ